MVKKFGNRFTRMGAAPAVSMSDVLHEGRSIVPVRAGQRARVHGRTDAISPKLRFHHYRSVQWILTGGPMAEAYVPVVVHDDCLGCLVCARTTEWFMGFARVACQLTGINLRDCLHWGHLFDNPKPLIVPTSNLLRCNQDSLVRLRESYFSLNEASRPPLRELGPWDQSLPQSERFEDRLTIVGRMVELWEDGQYIGWPS